MNVVSSGSNDELLLATAEAQLACSKLALKTDHVARTHAAALETVAIVKSDNPIAGAIKQSRQCFDDAIKGGADTQTSGTPDQWGFKAFCLMFADVVKDDTDQFQAITSLAADLNSEKDYIDVCSACVAKDYASDQYKGFTLVIIQFGDRATQVKRLWQQYVLGLDKGEIRLGRAARDPLARQTQDKYDKLSKLVKARK